MNDQFDVSLEDDELLDEVEMTANLMVAANRTDRPLTGREIDEILGIEPEIPRQRTASDGPSAVRH